MNLKDNLIIPKAQRSHFEGKLRGFVNSLLPLIRTPLSNDPEKNTIEANHIQEAQSAINAFFLPLKGDMVLLTNGDHNLLVAPDGEKVLTLQWKETHGLYTQISNPDIGYLLKNIGNDTQSLRNNLKLSPRGEIKRKEIKEPTLS